MVLNPTARVYLRFLSQNKMQDYIHQKAGSCVKAGSGEQT
jgi:hypothetical protein